MKNPIRTFKNGKTQTFIEHCRAVMKNLGVPAAAGMMRNVGWSLEGAMWTLLGKEVV